MSVVLVATITPLPEYHEDVIAAFTAIIPRVHDEDGCELYALHANADRLILVEKWASREALATHGKSAALTALNPTLAGKVAGSSELTALDAVPAGDPAKGQL